MPLCCCEDSALLAPHIWLDPGKHENRVTMAMAKVTKSEILRNFTSKKKKKKTERDQIEDCLDEIVQPATCSVSWASKYNQLCHVIRQNCS